eukprot:158372-Rhodomonas_salina.1
MALFSAITAPINGTAFSQYKQSRTWSATISCTPRKKRKRRSVSNGHGTSTGATAIAFDFGATTPESKPFA